MCVLSASIYYSLIPLLPPPPIWVNVLAPTTTNPSAPLREFLLSGDLEAESENMIFLNKYRGNALYVKEFKNIFSLIKDYIYVIGLPPVAYNEY